MLNIDFLFQNFVCNSAGVKNLSLLEDAWLVFEDVIAKSRPSDLAASHEKPEKLGLNKRERKEERQKKHGKKEKKHRPKENLEETDKGKKKKHEADRFDSEEEKNKKHNFEECEEELPDRTESEKAVKKKKKKHRLDVGDTVSDNSLQQNENHSLLPVSMESEDLKKKKKMIMPDRDKMHMTDTDGDDSVPDDTLQPNPIHNQTKLPDENQWVLQPRANCSPKFKWKVAIGRVLKMAPEDGMKMKKLERKVLALYAAAKSDSSHPMTKEELKCILRKKLANKSKYVILKERVKFNV